MVSYLAQKYAPLLTKEDANQLFKTLTKAYGSIKNAAKKCGIQRKTVYDWAQTTDMKLTTKIKILEASIKTRPDYALRFLLERSEEKTSEVLYIMLTRFSERAMAKELDRRTFLSIAKKFELVRKRHAGLIFGHLEDEVSDMFHLIRERAEDLEVSLPPPAIETMKSAQILELLPAIVKSLPEKETQAGHLDLAAKFNIPLELVKVSSIILQTVRAPYVERESATAGPLGQALWSLEEITRETRIPIQEPADSQLENGLWEGKS